MPQIDRTDAFSEWLEKLRDARAVAKILLRIKRLGEGNAGDVAPVGEGVSELKIDWGPGYRVYYTEVERGILLLLLCGGDKDTQSRDIERAKAMARDVKAARKTKGRAL
jgi:putative addiction module killer protein